jgi:transposase
MLIGFTSFSLPILLLKITNMHTSILVDIVAIHSNRNDAASHIKSIAKSTIVLSNSTNSIPFMSTLDDIRHFSKQMTSFELELKSLITTYFLNILTVPGIGIVIVGEIGDINRFHSPEVLVAFAGIDPVVIESGLFKAKQVHISRRDSKYLRTAIYTSTKVACINPNVRNNKFRDKYYKKKSSRQTS